MAPRIAVYAHRPKLSPPKKKANAADAAEPTVKPRPTIVVATSEKQLKRQRQERARAPQTDATPDPEIDAFFARNVRPGGALPPCKQ